MQTFKGVPIDLLWRNNVQRSHGAAVNVRHIPGGDTSYIDLGGRTTGRLRVPCYFVTEADYAAILALVGQQGTLVWHEGTQEAVLLSLTTSDKLPSGDRDGTVEFELL